MPEPTTPRGILAATIRRLHAQGYQYIPDPEGFDAMSRLLNDEWDTLAEFKKRKGGDCDGWTGASIELCEEEEAALPHARGNVPAAWYAVEGWVPRRGERLGHMWVALDTPEGEVWADPTWNLGPAAPEALGYRRDQKQAARWPVKRWRYKGWGQFGDEMRYGT